MHESNFIGIPIYHLQGIFGYQYIENIFTYLWKIDQKLSVYVYDGHDGIYILIYVYVYQY